MNQAQSQRRLIGPILLIALLLALMGGAAVFMRTLDRSISGNVESIAASSLQGLREQNRLSAFAARFVAVVTSEQTRFGLSAKKTLIMPGLVRYEVDLSRLAEKDLAWDQASKTLRVTLPPIEVAGPEVDLTAIREYSGGGILLALTDAETVLDAANRKTGREELLRQAREAVPMRLARDATRSAIINSFSMPLKAAGVEARVTARFADE